MSEYLVDCEPLRKAGYDPSTIDELAERNQRFQQLLLSPIGDHLRSVERQDSTAASGGRLLGARAVVEEVTQFAPGTFLFPLGYCPVWSSIGGNLVLYDAADRCFRWADHISFGGIGRDITVAATYEELAWSEENVRKAMVLVSADPPEQFFTDLRSGAYQRRLDELDSA